MPRNREEADLFFCSVTPLQNVRNENLGVCPNGIKFSQEVRPERVTTNRACILYQIITIAPSRPSPPPSTNYLIIMFCVFRAQYPPPHSIKVKSSVSSIIYSAYAAK